MDDELSGNLTDSETTDRFTALVHDPQYTLDTRSTFFLTTNPSISRKENGSGVAEFVLSPSLEDRCNLAACHNVSRCRECSHVRYGWRAGSPGSGLFSISEP